MDSVRLFVPLDRAEFEMLRALARTERRRPQEQAAHTLGEALRNLGLSDRSNDPIAEPLVAA